MYRGKKKTARCTTTKCQLVSLSLCCCTPASQRTDLFSASFALRRCPAEFLSNNPYPKLLHSWIPPSDPRALTIGKTFQLCQYKEGHCERSEPTKRAAGMQRNRLWPDNKATQGVSAIKGEGLLCASSPQEWDGDESVAQSDDITLQILEINESVAGRVSRHGIKKLQADTVLSGHPETPVHLWLD